MDSKELAEWAETRLKSKVIYSLIHGVLTWGLPAGIVTFLFKEPVGENFDIEMLIVYLGFWSVGGFFYGLISWFSNERKYKKQLQISNDV
jgi:predicted permease